MPPTIRAALSLPLLLACAPVEDAAPQGPLLTIARLDGGQSVPIATTDPNRGAVEGPCGDTKVEGVHFLPGGDSAATLLFTLRADTGMSAANISIPGSFIVAPDPRMARAEQTDETGAIVPVYTFTETWEAPETEPQVVSLTITFRDDQPVDVTLTGTDSAGATAALSARIQGGRHCG
ncbi:hypothetical protein ACMA5I_03620 [Paracoccaceae bacterium GXU_MW_L88]